MIDSAKIHVKSGKGGNGFASFITVFYNPKGGPDGGNGGKGGNVYVRATNNIKTLIEYRAKNVLIAEDGVNGQRNYRYGRNGADMIIPVPIGTVVYKVIDKKRHYVGDLSKIGDELLVAKGGLGGFGNAHYKSSTNRQPRKYTEGKPGESFDLELELKLLSNVGLIGFPSVGKSTLLNSLANTNAKTASYHFTTLSPNLGVLNTSEKQSLVIADLPGLIEGASEGKGLGEAFLKHAERCGILIHLLDPTQTTSFTILSSSDISIEDLEDWEANLVKDLKNNYDVINKELSLWSKNLIKKRQIVVLNKLDITEIARIKEKLKVDLEKSLGVSVFMVSAITKEGIANLVRYLQHNYDTILNASNSQLHKTSKKNDFKEINLENLPNKRIRY